MFAVIRIPDFSLQSLLRHEPSLWWRAVALLDEREKNAVVFQMTPAARESGVSEGLNSTQALARCPQLLIKNRSIPQEQNARDLLLQTAFNFSPRIEATADGVCTLDLQGLSLFRENHSARITEWADKIISALGSAGLRAGVGIAPTPNVAGHAARCARPFLFVENPAEFIAPLPVENLEPPQKILELLQRWGVRTIGEFTALGKDNLAERLGPEGLEVFDRAAIDVVRPLELTTPPENFSESLEFEQEIESLPPLLFVLNRFVEQLALRIGQRHQVIAELHLRLQLSSGDAYEAVLKVPSPTGSRDVLFRMLQTHLENVRTDAAIVALELSATPFRQEIHQFDLFEAALRDPNQFAETLARLSALCGAENVGTPVLLETHRPDAFRMIPPPFEKNSTRAGAENSERIGPQLRRFRPPLQANVRTANDAPVSVQAFQLNARIASRSGPWRTSGDWWEQARLWNRDEWDVQTEDGALYRIYRENESWFVEGIYD